MEKYYGHHEKVEIVFQVGKRDRAREARETEVLKINRATFYTAEIIDSENRK